MSEHGRSPAAGRPTYSCIQQKHTYLLPLPGSRQTNLIDEQMLDYAESDALTLLAYSPLLAGAYARRERPDGEYAHAVNSARLAVLDKVADLMYCRNSRHHTGLGRYAAESALVSSSDIVAMAFQKEI